MRFTRPQCVHGAANFSFGFCCDREIFAENVLPHSLQVTSRCISGTELIGQMAADSLIPHGKGTSSKFKILSYFVLTSSLMFLIATQE